jgi:hypothetical protein
VVSVYKQGLTFTSIDQAQSWHKERPEDQV